MRLYLLIFLKYLRRNLKLVIPIFAILFLLIFLQLRFNLFGEPNTIRIGIIGTYQEHDLPLEVTSLLSDSLPDINKGRETNNDATVYKFKIKDDLKWEDGSNVIASDIGLNIADVEISTIDDQTIQFKLKDSYSPFPSLLSKPVFKKNTLIGTGPYKITKIEKSKIFITKLTLKSKEPNLPKVVIRFYPSEKVAQTGFNLGEVQVLLGFSNPSFFSDNPKVSIDSKNDFGKIVTILYNTSDPIFSNRSIRQALSFQTPSIEGFEVANNPYPSALWAYDKEAKKYLNNQAEAASAMKRAKDALDESLLKENLIITTTPNLEEVAKKLTDAWEALGFDVKIRVESGIPQNFQILLITQSIPSDPDQYFLWHSSQEKTNLSKYSSARVDKDLEDGRKTANEEIRKEKYLDFQRTLLEDAPATFLYFPKYNIVYLQKAESNLNKLLPLFPSL